jgi:hypothetical protein
MNTDSNKDVNEQLSREKIANKKSPKVFRVTTFQIFYWKKQHAQKAHSKINNNNEIAHFFNERRRSTLKTHFPPRLSSRKSAACTLYTLGEKSRQPHLHGISQFQIHRQSAQSLNCTRARPSIKGDELERFVVSGRMDAFLRCRCTPRMHSMLHDSDEAHFRPGWWPTWNIEPKSLMAMALRGPCYNLVGRKLMVLWRWLQ